MLSFLVGTVLFSAPAQVEIPAATPIAQTQSPQWRAMDETERKAAWDYILQSPLGVGALNRLAIEGFISPECDKSFYSNDRYGGMQFMLRVHCPSDRGVSAAVRYDEMRVIFNRFETSIDNFEIQRVRPDDPEATPLPEP